MCAQPDGNSAASYCSLLRFFAGDGLRCEVLCTAELDRKVDGVDESVSFFARIDGVVSANVERETGEKVRLRPTDIEEKKKLKMFLVAMVDEITESIESQQRFIDAGSPQGEWY
jgi:hypothetical protein